MAIYLFAARSEGFNTSLSNAGAQTLLPISPAGRVSNLSIKQLIYPGWTGRLICEYQPWFGSSNHQSVGYNENASATVAAQNSFMIAEGCDINLVDWYGSLSPMQTFNLATANAVFADLRTHRVDTVTCLQAALVQDMDYINLNYANSAVYWTDAGQPVIAYFGGKSDWPILTPADWDAVWLAVKAHTDTYASRASSFFNSVPSAPPRMTMAVTAGCSPQRTVPRSSSGGDQIRAQSLITWTRYRVRG